MAIGSILLLLGLLGSLALGRANAVLMGAYVVMNFLYSMKLKHVAILDLMCIAMGFVLRVMAGSAAIHVEASHWLLMCTFLLALFLAIAKRRQEIVSLGTDAKSHRRVLLQYNVPWLEQAATLTAGTTLVSYALYTVSPETQARFGTDHLIYTLPFVIYGILRYLQLIHASNKTGNPTTALLADKHLLACISGWVLTCAAVIYL
jgi:4-hydroxybenzoate polyprenyltransferase